MRCSYYPQSLAQIHERFGRSGARFGRVDPQLLFIPERPSLTGVTGAAHRSDRCRGSMGFASAEHLGELVVVPYYCCFEFGSVWSSIGLLGGFGISWLGPV
jgi:hypothetical protein